MYMYKRYAALLLAIACIAGTSGCGDKEEISTSSESSNIIIIEDVTKETSAVTEIISVTAKPENTTETTKVTEIVTLTSTEINIDTNTTAIQTSSVKSETTTATKIESIEQQPVMEDTPDVQENPEEIPEEAPAENSDFETEHQPNEQETEPETEVSTEVPEEVSLKLGDDCTAYVNSTPYIDKQEAVSCMGEGYDRVYTYEDYTLYTFADYAGTGDYLQEIDLTTDKNSTNAGIHVGNSRAEVEAAYGISESGIYTASDGNSLQFIYDGDTVSIIMYYLNN